MNKTDNILVHYYLPKFGMHARYSDYAIKKKNGKNKNIFEIWHI